MNLDGLQALKAQTVAEKLCVSENKAREIMHQLPHFFVARGEKQEAIRITVRTLWQFIEGEIELGQEEPSRKRRVTMQKRTPQLPSEDERYIHPNDVIPIRRKRA